MQSGYFASNETFARELRLIHTPEAPSDLIFSPQFREQGHAVLHLFDRPFVEFVSAPFWSVVSTRFRQAKNILLMALFSWIVFTVAIGLINPPPHSCWRENGTHHNIEPVGFTSTIRTTNSPAMKLRTKRQAIALPTILSKTINKTKEIIDQGKASVLNQSQSLDTTTVSSTSARRRKTTTTARRTTTRPIAKANDEYEDDAVESGEEDDPVPESTSTRKPQKQQAEPIDQLPLSKPQKTMGNPISIKHTNVSLVKPLASAILYDAKDVRNVFMVFLLLIIIGEFFSAPAITLAVSSRRRSNTSRIRFDLGCVHPDAPRSRHRTVRTAAHVR